MSVVYVFGKMWLKISDILFNVYSAYIIICWIFFLVPKFVLVSLGSMNVKLFGNLNLYLEFGYVHTTKNVFATVECHATAVCWNCCSLYIKLCWWILTLLCPASHNWDFDRQCRHRSVAAECSIWYGSTLFALPLNTGISLKIIIKKYN